jgi:hypothetical protein|nr:MAG TPA: hypothetical protein [Caudoviricetes sp.]
MSKLRSVDFASQGKHINKIEETDQEQISRLEQENLDLRMDIDDLQTICDYLEGRVTTLTEMYIEANNYIKKKRL